MTSSTSASIVDGMPSQEPWQSRAAIRMSHLGNSSSKCEPIPIFIHKNGLALDYGE